MAKRKLWNVVLNYADGTSVPTFYKPETKRAAYGIAYEQLTMWPRRSRPETADIWVDDRNGRGYRLLGTLTQEDPDGR